jgi:hypothetical protein
MAIGITTYNNVRVELGLEKDKLLEDFDKNNVKYEIEYDKENKLNIKETFISINGSSLEVNMENGIVNYIKMGNTEFSNLCKIDDAEENTLEYIRVIKEHINEKLNSNGELSIKIERIDTKSMNVLIIISSEKEKARVNVIKNNNGDVFISTLQTI